MDPEKRLASKLSALKNQPEALWSVAINKAAGLVSANQLSAERLEQLASACRSPRQLLIITDYGAKTDQPEGMFSSLASRVDESPYSLTDWLEAIETFHTWIGEHSQATNLETLLGYISCCTEANPNSPNQPELKETVLAMLEQYGFDG